MNDFFEAGVETAEGDLAGVAYVEETVEFIVGDGFLGDDDFGDRMIPEDAFQGIDGPKNGVPVDLRSLIPGVIVDEPDGVQLQARITDQFVQRMDTIFSHSVEEDFSPSIIVG